MTERYRSVTFEKQ